jgi:LPXTG-motif cell wall-anchored protein
MSKLLAKTSFKQTAIMLTILVLAIFLVMATALNAKTDEPTINDQISISVTKVWEGLAQDQTPEVVTISLVNKDTYATVGSLQFTFSGQNQTFTVPQYAYDDKGKLKEITYDVAEAASANYTTKTSGKADTGFTVTNTIKDNGNGNGNGENDVCHIYLDINDHQGNAHFITDMTKDEWLAWIADHGLFAVQKSNNDGSNGWITWHIYATQADADAAVNNQIEVVQIRYLLDAMSVTKVWGNGTTPSNSVRVYLLTGNDTIDDVTANTPYITLSAPGWTGSFTRLDPNEQYQVVEDPADIPVGVASIVSGNMDNGFTITNTLDVIDIPVEKVWQNDDQQSHTAIQVQLYADGSPVGQPLPLNDGNEWQDSFDDLAVFTSGGAEIVYTVQEVNAPAGYNVQITGDQYQGFTITNTLQEEDTVDISGTKVWLNDSDAVRPGSITIYLYADRQLYDSQVITGTGKIWSWSFTGLPKYREVIGAAPVEIVYTVGEESLADYTSRIEGTIIYNTYAEDEDENDDEDEDEDEDIEEPDVPMDDTPDLPIVIDEPEMPLDDSPQTGDNVNYNLMLLLAAVALASLAGFIIIKRSARQ